MNRIIAFMTTGIFAAAFFTFCEGGGYKQRNRDVSN